MDTEILHVSFTKFLEASKNLAIDLEFRTKVSVARGRLLPLQIGQFVQIQVCPKTIKK